MTSKRYGDPVLTLRIPKESLAALKLLAARESTSVSGILRALIDQRLKESGITPAPVPVDGQITSIDLGV